MATLAPLTATELDAELSAWQAGLVPRESGEVLARRSELRALHDLLARAAVETVAPDEALASRLTELAAAATEAAVTALAPRPRTVLRLLRAGFPGVAWQVLADNAVGVVADSSSESTATGAQRPSARRPLRVLTESAAVFARLPGFRDPRFGVPDAVYDVTDLVGIQHRLDEITVADGVLTLAGWGALDLLPCRAEETVRLLLQCSGSQGSSSQGSGGQEPVEAVGSRLRRADLVSGRGDALTRRAWAGWVASVPVAALAPGEWSVTLELDHDGVRRQAELGTDSGDLARLAARAGQRVGRRMLRWETGSAPWRLIVEDSRLPWSLGGARSPGRKGQRG